jgi:WD40 repeat protein
VSAQERGDGNGANPYVGPVPFGKTDPLYGRDREVRELRDLLISQRIVVFYSPSGAGKTSLIEANAEAPLPPESAGSPATDPHAGLRWEMQRARFRVLPVVRVNRLPKRRLTKGENRYVLSALLSLEEHHPGSTPRRAADLTRMTLAEYLKEWPPEPGANDVLIFDQFEELLTLDPTDRPAKEGFLTQVREVLRDGERWALFALREDHLGGLDPYAAELPTRLAASYRLDLLGPDAAKLAMQNPAVNSGVEFPEDAAHKLLEDLRRVRAPRLDGSTEERPGLYVEPVHLQVVCRRLWDEAVRRGRPIDPALVAEVGAVDDALRHFYAAAVAAVADDTKVPERAIRGWCGEQLITNHGIRSQVIEEADQAAGLPTPAVDALVARHLVRRESRRGVPWLELAHDRLIAPILADNNTWYLKNLNSVQQAAKAWDNGGQALGFLLAGDALELAEAWAAEPGVTLTEVEKAFLAASRQQRDQLALEQAKKERDAAEQRAAEQAYAARRIKRWAMAVALLALVALGVAWFANDRRVDATAQRAEAEVQRAEAEAQRQTVSSNLLAKQAEDEPDRAAALWLVAEALRNDTSGARRAMLTLLEIPTPPLVSEHPVATFAGGEGEIRGLAFSPDSPSFASLASDGSLRLWSAAIGARPEPRATATVLGTPRGVAFAPAGEWKSTTDPRGIRLTSTEEPDGVKLAATIGAQGVQLIATAGSQGVRLWNARTLSALVQVSTEDATSVAFSPDGKQLVYGGTGGRLRLYEIDEQRTVTLLPQQVGSASRINAVAYSSRGWIAAGREDGTVTLWRNVGDFGRRREFDTGLWAPNDRSSAGDATAITSLAFDPEGNVLVTGNRSGVVMRWNVNVAFEDPHDPIYRIGGELSTERVEPVEGLAYSSDAKLIAAADGSGRVALWQAAFHSGPGAPAKQQPIETLARDHAGSAWSVAFSPNGAFLATGSGDGEISLWSRVGQPLSAATPANLGIGSVAAVAFTADGRGLAAGGAAGIVRLCDTTAASVTCETVADRQGHVRSLAFSPSGDRLAWGNYAGSVTVADLTGDLQLTTLKARGRVEALAFSLDGRTLFAGTDDWAEAPDAADGESGAVVLWDLDELTPERLERVTALAVSPTGSKVVSSDEEVTVWTVEQEGGEAGLSLVPTLALGKASTRSWAAVRTLTFDRSGTRLAAAGGDAAVWNAATGETILFGQLFMLGVQEIAFAPDGRLLVSGSRSGEIRLWDLARGGWPLGVLGRMPAAVVGLAWSDDGTLIAVDIGGSAVKFYGNSSAWQGIACRAAGRETNPEEVQRYFQEDASEVCLSQAEQTLASPEAYGD